MPPPAPGDGTSTFLYNVTSVTYEFNSASVTKAEAAGNCSARGGLLVSYTSGAIQVTCLLGHLLLPAFGHPCALLQ